MIEKTVIDHLAARMGVPVCAEIPERPPGSFCIVDSTGDGSCKDYLYTSTVAVQSYASSKGAAAQLNERVKTAMATLADVPDLVTKVSLNSSYSYTDTENKRYRYQSLFDIVHYREDD